MKILMNGRLVRPLATVFLLMIASGSVSGQRLPVLPQINLPHPYYFRELYLPQLTAGPASADWLADGSGMVFSMGGSLWRHNFGSAMAEQLTDGEGYDYQPDVSPDGKWVVFTRYNGSSMELQLMDLVNLQVTQLTSNKGVNLEPRWSPDGSSLAFVSTLNTGHFLLYLARLDKTQLADITCLTPDRQSQVKRYYYSPWDHAINPVFTPDGKSILFVSNQEVAHGTGFITRIDLSTKQTQVLHREETSWAARPDVSPDGSRMVYSSYQGRNNHQLWLLPVFGGYPIPLTFGDYDCQSPRWSPDGQSVLFISNREGTPTLWTVGALDGKQEMIRIKDFRYIKPHQDLVIEVRDEKGVSVPARISVTDGRGKFYGPVGNRIHADDGIFTAQYKFEHHYFHSPGRSIISVPKEKLLITVSHGPYYNIAKANVDGTKPFPGPLKVTLDPFTLPSGQKKGISGDLHVHMNYGGSYLNTPADLLVHAAAEDVNLVFNLIVNKEQRVPDIRYFGTADVRSSDGKVVLTHAQEFHTSFWGHLGLLNLSENLILPDFSGYPETAAASLYPDNTWVVINARRQGGLAGYVHPFEVSEVIPQPAPSLTNELPVSAALGLVDYYELIGFSDHRASELVWHKLLNCGLRIPAGAGTDLMANYSSLRGPMGLNRVVVRMDGLIDKADFLRRLKSGESFVTNGPIIGLTAQGKQAGETITIGPAGGTLDYSAFLRSQVPLDYFEVVWNGQVIAKHTLLESRRFADVTGKLKIKGPGWLLLRAGSDKPHPDLPDLYPFASTNPIWVETSEEKVFRSKEAAQWFMPWVDQVEKAVRDSGSFRAEKERREILSQIEAARSYYQGIIQLK